MPSICVIAFAQFFGSQHVLHQVLFLLMGNVNTQMPLVLLARNHISICVPLYAVQVLEAVCVILDVKPAKVKDDSGKMVPDFWKPSVGLMNEKASVTVCLLHYNLCNNKLQ